MNKEETIIHIMRHGETDWNLQRRWQGSLDIPLNQTGRRQAEEVAREFTDISLAAIYTSHLKRAIETGEIIGKSKKITPNTYFDFREQSFGSLEGRWIDETLIELKEKFIMIETLPSLQQLHFKFVEDMESLHEVLQRTLPIFKQLAVQHIGEEILIVSHGNVIKSLLMLITSKNWHAFKIENCTWFSFIYRCEDQMIGLLDPIIKNKKG